jgi:hypothetical protein
VIGVGCNVKTSNLSSSLIGSQQGGKNPHDGGLSSAVRAEKAEHSSLFNLK